MKPSEIIKGYVESDMREEKRDEILDQMAEDIKYLKDSINSPFPYMVLKPKEREWEK